MSEAPLVLAIPGLRQKYVILDLPSGNRTALVKEGIRFTEDIARMINDLAADRRRRVDSQPPQQPATLHLIAELIANGVQPGLLPLDWQQGHRPDASPGSEPDSPTPT